MSQQLAVLLRDWRAQRGLSLSSLAARAGLSKGTVSGWERGLHQPRLPELEAVFAALDVPLPERPSALALIDAARARRALAASAASSGLQPLDQPVPGHLLLALRRRRGLTLDAVAQALGVDRASVSRWERSVSTPSAERLAMLLDLLGAHAEERAALARGWRLFLPPAAERPTLELLLHQFGGLIDRTTYGDRRLLDLEFLAWQAAIWPLATRSDAARQTLGKACAFYAEWLSWDGRWREANSAATRAIDLLRTTDPRTPDFIGAMRCAIQVCARATAQSTAVNAQREAVEQLRVWLPDAAGSIWEVDLYRHLAERAWWAGEHDAAVAFADRSCSLVERLEAPGILQVWCPLGRADLYLRSSRPHEALALLQLPEIDLPPHDMIRRRLRWARALHAVGDSKAEDWLTDATALIEQYDYAPFRAEADALRRSF
jgi:transcriptional regulator with XRE-family HTH domain